jgi:nicotinate-nucleotide pyrophosphorylase (carboxylating)
LFNINSLLVSLFDKNILMGTDFDKLIDQLIVFALEEDLGDGDHTSLSCVPPDATGSARLLVKQDGIIAGVDLAARILKKVDEKLKVEFFMTDGKPVKYGDIVFQLTGLSQSILKAERLLLNVMQRMSGIATKTRRYVDSLKGLKTKVLDTRKTSPGMRVIEKMAVRIGGGQNHRFGLYDMILIKDNHVDFAGGIEKAIRKSKDYLLKIGKNLPVEIEVRNFNELNQVIEIGHVDRIMLDNFSVDDTRKAVQLINNRYETESSGGINLSTVRAYAECGVDYVSVGELTHQIESLDLSLKAL